jgi:hypothetical protein
MKSAISKLLIICTVIILISGCDILGWKKYTSVEGGFSVTLPAEPKGNKIILDTEVGRTYLNLYLLNRKDDKFAYSVGYVDYPPELFQKKSIIQILNDARDSAARNIQGVLTSESEVSIKQYPGREIVIEAFKGQVIVKGKFFLVGNRLYQLMATTGKKFADSYNIKRFLDSFELIETESK